MEEFKSKSQQKREAAALQALGVELSKLSLTRLEAYPLSEKLKQTIIEAQSLKSHGAIRRQAQLIGKLMRSADVDAILAIHEQLNAKDKAQSVDFHECEAWRTRLINDGNTALTEFVTQYSPNDVQQLRQLIKKAKDEQIANKNTGAGRALFRYLRSYIS